jgi:hypothetical protein
MPGCFFRHTCIWGIESTFTTRDIVIHLGRLFY